MAYTYKEHRIKRRALVLQYILDALRILRMKDFDPLVDFARTAYGWRFFPLGRTTVKSTIVGLVKDGFIQMRVVQVASRRIRYYRVTKAGREYFDSVKDVL